MSAIEASSVGVKTMADGTLRITVDIEPTNAQAAFALFGSPGTPMALAALKVGHAIPKEPDASTTPGVGPPLDKPKGGPLAKLAGMWCNDPEFLDWLTERGDFAAGLSPGLAADVVRDWCCIESRAELDSNPDAERRFQEYIRGPYMKHKLAHGVTA